MIVLVCGGRSYGDEKTAFSVLDDLHRVHKFTRLIHGAAPGADTLAARWAAQRGVPVAAYPANWVRYGRSAGPRRNEQMLREGRPDLVVALPGGRGTAHMVRLAREAGVAVMEIGAESKAADQGAFAFVRRRL